MIALDRLKEVLSYDPETGLFTWLVTNSPRAVKGTIAGYKSKDYIVVRVDNILYPAHCLAWFYMTGKEAELFIDHEDKNKYNNKWINLREATTSQNVANTEKRSTNKSGFKGVSWAKRQNKWVASITLNYKTKNLGYYSNIEDAVKAYNTAAKLAFGEFATN